MKDLATVAVTAVEKGVRQRFEFDEEKHPRDDKGRWGDGGGGSAVAAVKRGMATTLGLKPAQFYSDSQERDESGKWTDGGGGGERDKAISAKGEAAHSAAEKHHSAMMNAPEFKDAKGSKLADAHKVINAHATAAEAHLEAARTGTKGDGKYSREASERAYKLHDAFRKSAAVGKDPAQARHDRLRSLERPFPKK